MAKTFRQEVEEIQNPIKSCNDKLCEKYKSVGFNGWANCVQCRTDRICEAAKRRLGDEMPDETSKYGILHSSEYRTGKLIGAKTQKASDQAHIAKETEG